MPVSRWPMARPCPAMASTTSRASISPSGTPCSLAGRQQGSVHAEQVTHVLRDVELTGDVLDRVKVVARRGGHLPRRDRRRRRRTATRRPPAELRRELLDPEHTAEEDEHLLTRRRRRRVRRAAVRTEGTTSDGVRMYLREIGQVDLLTGDDERRLAQLIEAGQLAAARIDEAATTGPPVDDVELRRLVRSSSAASGPRAS